MPPEKNHSSLLDLNGFRRAIAHHWKAVGACAALGLAAASAWTLVQPKLYTAQAIGIVYTGSSSDISQGIQSDSFAKSKATQYQVLAQNRVVLDNALESAKLAPGGSVSVAVPLDTSQLQVRVVRDNPQDAAKLADAFVASLGDAVRDVENGDVAGTGSKGNSVVQIRPFVEAKVPTSPSSPRVKLALLAGLLVGTLLGIAFAIVRQIIDRRIRSVQVLEDEFGVSVLGTIPVHTRPAGQRRLSEDAIRGSGRNDDSRAREAFKELRTNLQFMNPDHPPRIIAVSSPLPSEGKSTVALNLAVTLAVQGESVTLVDGDLRRPTVAKSFGFIEGVGLTDVIVGNAAIAEVIQEVPETPGLRVLGCGPVPPNPSEILASERLGQVMAELARDGMVIIDSPPLIPVTDAAILAARFDGCLLVVQAGHTTTDQLSKAISIVSKVNGRILGAVLNQVPSGPGAYGYQYYGHYYYYSSDNADGKQQRTKKRRRRSTGTSDTKSIVISPASDPALNSEATTPLSHEREAIMGSSIAGPEKADA